MKKWIGNIIMVSIVLVLMLIGWLIGGIILKWIG